MHTKELKVPRVKDGQTQVIPEFEDRDLWIRHDLWVETEFDSDGDGKLDRMHVDVTRPRQTDTQDIKLPVILHCSPYFGGTGSAKPPYMWDVRHELGATPPERQRFDAIKRRDTRPIISKSYVNDWVPHGYAVVHSSSPGTGFSQGCPTIGKDQQIGLMIFSSDKDFTLWPDPGTELTVDLDATSLMLPIVGGIEAYSKGIE